ncbi:MAG: hypothetical protein J6Z00_01855 [Clostridia bacterium]|nr:hypothetical protein [Clostridia bacterium]
MARRNDVRIRKAHVKTKTDSSANREYENDEVAEVARSVAERRMERSKKPKSKKRLIILAIILLLGLIVYLRWDVLNPVSVFNWGKIVVTGGESGDGFPAKAEGSSVVKMDSVSNQLALLTGNTLTVYNKSAGVVQTENHNFASPILSTAGNHILLAEMGGTRIQTQTLGSAMKEVNTESNIMAADIAGNGSFVVATGSSKSYASEVICYSKSGKEKLHWYSSDILVMDVAIRNDGRQMAVVGVQSNQGATESKLLVFNTSSNNEPTKYGGTGVLLCQVEFLSNSVVGAVGDTESWVVRVGKNDFTKISYTDKKLIGCAFSGSQIGLVLQNYGTTTGCELLGISKSGKEDFSIDFDETYQSFSSGSYGRFFLLTDSNVIMCNSSGKTKAIATEIGGLKVCGTFAGDAVVLGLTAMNCYSF